jgi:hypothetical protein
LSVNAAWKLLREMPMTFGRSANEVAW